MNGYIFRCSEATYKECMDRLLFGASDKTGNKVRNVGRGDILFLYNTTREFLYGPFAAESDVSKNIVPKAWGGGYPWQVKISKIENESFPIRRKEIQGLISFWGKFPQFSLTKKQIVKLKDALSKATEPLDSEQDFRAKFPRNVRTFDGHMVQSKAEVLIDNWLYNHNIIHESEPKLPESDYWHADFLIPLSAEPQALYIEYWGMDTEDYLADKEKKLADYKKFGYTLIELNPGDEKKLDIVLKRQLEPYFSILVKPKL